VQTISLQKIYRNQRDHVPRLQPAAWNPRKRGGHYLFTIAGQGKSEDAVKSAGNLFCQAVFQVLPGE